MRKRLVKVSVKPSRRALSSVKMSLYDEAVKYFRESLFSCAMPDQPKCCVMGGGNVCCTVFW